MTNKERFKEIFISQVTRPGAADLLAWLGTTDFFEAPASTRFHGAYPGGLVEHSLNVYYALRRRVFLEQVARPAGWKFMEIITADSTEEIDRWTELTKGAK